MRATARSMVSARRLRRQLSLPEMLLWRILRLSRRDVRFRKQHAIAPLSPISTVQQPRSSSRSMGRRITSASTRTARAMPTWRHSGLRSFAFLPRRCSPIRRQSLTASTACAIAWQAPPPLSLAAEWSPSPLLRNREVPRQPRAPHRRQMGSSGAHGRRSTSGRDRGRRRCRRPSATGAP